MVLLSAEQGCTGATIAAIVREREATVLRWLTRYPAEGLDGLHDAPRPGRPADATETYRAELVAAVRQRPRSLGLPCSWWTLQCWFADLAEHTRIRGSDAPAVAQPEGHAVAARASRRHPGGAVGLPRRVAQGRARRLRPRASGLGTRLIQHRRPCGIILGVVLSRASLEVAKT